MMKKLLFLVSVILISTSCVPSYRVNDIEERALSHKVVAILPFEMLFVGVTPDGLTKEDIKELELAESKSFQISMFNELIAHTSQRHKITDLRIQDYNKTNRILKENEISLIESNGYDESELAALLGVDVILKGRIQKERYMTDLESFGIEIGIHIVSVLSRHHGGPWWLYSLTKSKEIFANYSLIDGSDGSTLWSISFEDEANWTRSSNDIIRDINERAARRLPVYSIHL
jgi:hypothetical protein